MDNSKVSVAIKNIKEIQNELTVSENRLEYVKSEAKNKTVERDNLAKQIEEMKALHNQDIERKSAAFREEMNRVSEAKAKLDEQRKETEEILLALRKEKREFETEKSLVLENKADLEKKNAKVGEFVTLMKRAAEGL